MSIQLNCGILEPFENDFCDTSSTPGRIIGLVFVKKNAPGIPEWNESAETFVNAIKALALSDEAIIIGQLSGEKPEATTNEIDGFGTSPTYKAGKLHTINFMDLRVKVNQEFWESLSDSISLYNVFYVTPDLIWANITKEGKYANVGLYLNPNIVIERGTNTMVMRQATLTWTYPRNAFNKEIDTNELLPSI